jgi:hypothetical protein
MWEFIAVSHRAWQKFTLFPKRYASKAEKFLTRKNNFNLLKPTGHVMN